MIIRHAERLAVVFSVIRGGASNSAVNKAGNDRPLPRLPPPMAGIRP